LWRKGFSRACGAAQRLLIDAILGGDQVMQTLYIRWTRQADYDNIPT
jgi:hypothetical protein